MTKGHQINLTVLYVLESCASTTADSVWIESPCLTWFEKCHRVLKEIDFDFPPFVELHWTILRFSLTLNRICPTCFQIISFGAVNFFREIFPLLRDVKSSTRRQKCLHLPRLNLLLHQEISETVRQALKGLFLFQVLSCQLHFHFLCLHFSPGAGELKFLPLASIWSLPHPLPAFPLLLLLDRSIFLKASKKRVW